MMDSVQSEKVARRCVKAAINTISASSCRVRLAKNLGERIEIDDGSQLVTIHRFIGVEYLTDTATIDTA